MDEQMVARCREIMKEVNEELKRRGEKWRLLEVPSGVMKVEVDSTSYPALIETDN